MIEGYILGRKGLTNESDVNDLYEEVFYPTYEDAQYTLNALPPTLRPTLEVYEVKVSLVKAPDYEEFEVPVVKEEVEETQEEQ